LICFLALSQHSEALLLLRPRKPEAFSKISRGVNGQAVNGQAVNGQTVSGQGVKGQVAKKGRPQKRAGLKRGQAVKEGGAWH
jgi:hypothetical protein